MRELKIEHLVPESEFILIACVNLFFADHIYGAVRATTTVVVQLHARWLPHEFVTHTPSLTAK